MRPASSGLALALALAIPLGACGGSGASSPGAAGAVTGTDGAHAGEEHGDDGHGDGGTGGGDGSTPEAMAPDAQDIEVRRALRIPDALETPAVPDYNRPTRAAVELGRHLFYDERLSANETVSCASCHIQALGFADGERLPRGATGQTLRRNSSGLANVAWAGSLTWSHNGFAEIEDQLMVPLHADDPIELGITDGLVEEVLGRFADDPHYVPMFREAYPALDGELTSGAVRFALASFVRGLVSADSPFDRFRAGDVSALDERQKRGFALFNGERLECFHCHSGTNLSTSYRDANTIERRASAPFFNNGLYNVSGAGDYPAHDQGLYELTLDTAHRGRFRPQSLRNVAVTAPYMHDGSIATLHEVVAHYARGGRLIESGPNAGDGRLSPTKSTLVGGFSISAAEIDDVVAFLESLTDETFLNEPRFSDPFGGRGRP